MLVGLEDEIVKAQLKVLSLRIRLRRVEHAAATILDELIRALIESPHEVWSFVTKLATARCSGLEAAALLRGDTLALLHRF